MLREKTIRPLLESSSFLSFKLFAEKLERFVQSPRESWIARYIIELASIHDFFGTSCGRPPPLPLPSPFSVPSRWKRSAKVLPGLRSGTFPLPALGNCSSSFIWVRISCVADTLFVRPRNYSCEKNDIVDKPRGKFFRRRFFIESLLSIQGYKILPGLFDSSRRAAAERKRIFSIF